jgi:hypothetical protein
MATSAKAMLEAANRRAARAARVVVTFIENVLVVAKQGTAIRLI